MSFISKFFGSKKQGKEGEVKPQQQIKPNASDNAMDIQDMQMQSQQQSNVSNSYDFPIFQQQSNTFQACQSDPFGGFRSRKKGPARISEITFPDQEIDAEIVCIIVTVCDGSSYDQLFNQVAQQSPDGTRVKTYACNSSALRALDALWNQGNNEALDEDILSKINQLSDELAVIDPECVVFNWECCSCYSDKGFNQSNTVPFIKQLLDKGFMVMCSDFSLKALIKEWDAELLGPNCFKKVGEFGDNFVLRFDSKTLVDCPSTQLQQVGELCDEGKAAVHAMPGTIAYTVDLAKADNNSYVCEVLTITQEMHGVRVSKNDMLTIGEESGAAGHVLLKYPSGGQLLTSAGHWLELSKLDVNVERLLSVVQSAAKGDYYDNMCEDINSSATMQERREKTAYWTNNYIQTQAPCYTVSGKRSKGFY